MLRAFAVVWFLLGLTACSTIFEGTNQRIAVTTEPAGADCTLSRNGAALARISQTPGEATVAKTKDDITIDCDKSGYQQASFLNHSGVADEVFADVIIPGGSIGLIIDAMTGAYNKYDDQVNLNLTPVARIARVAPIKAIRPAAPAAMLVSPSSPVTPAPSAPADFSYEAGPVIGL